METLKLVVGIILFLFCLKGAWDTIVYTVVAMYASAVMSPVMRTLADEKHPAYIGCAGLIVVIFPVIGMIIGYLLVR